MNSPDAAFSSSECLRCGRAIIGTAYEGCHANLLICGQNQRGTEAFLAQLEDELLFRTGLKERDERV